MSAPYNLTKTFLGIIFFYLFSLNINAQLPAFPGAEGYGKYSVGGRGGVVYKVTNLNDSGPGSFREACEASGPRTVIFEVGGRINVLSEIRIDNPYITIAGQHSLGDGILLSKESTEGSETRDPILIVNTHDVIIRYIRMRRQETNASGSNDDVFYISGGHDIIVDHSSFSWGGDGNFDFANYCCNYQNVRPTQEALYNVTSQYNVMTNTWNSEKNSLVSNGATKITWFRNAYINSGTRNPSISTPNPGFAPAFDTYYEMANNFYFDYLNGPSMRINEDNPNEVGTMYANFLNNRALDFKNGILATVESPVPHTYTNRRWLRASTAESTQVSQSIFVQGNITPYRPNDTYDEWSMAQNGGTSSNSSSLIPNSLRSSTIHQLPLVVDNVVLYDAVDVWYNIKDHVGASIPTRDSEDLRAISDVNNETSTYIQDANQTFPVMSNGTPLEDIDNDGMPDFWEILEFGNLDSDGVVDTDGDGYTDLEEYLNQIANGQIPDIPAEGVTITPNSAILNVPETLTLSTNFTPNNSTNQNGVWISSDESIATVSSTGLISSISEGIATITFTSNDGGYTDTAEITVTNIVIPLVSVTINPSNVTLEVGEENQLTTIFDPIDTTDSLGTWTSSDESVVIVDENGNIAGVNEGQADVTYTSNIDGVTSTISVTVIDTFYGTYEFYNAFTDIMLMNITGDTDINLIDEGNEINFRSIPQGGDLNTDVESVRVDWTGPTSGTWIESGPIYAGLPNGHLGLDFEPYVVVEGTYNFTVTYYSENGASGNIVATDTFALSFFFSSLPIANAGPDQGICLGNITTLTASGGPNFLWNNGETTASIDVNPLITTTYTVSVFDNEGNTDEDSVTVTVNAIPIANAGQDQIICEGETITLTASGGDSYLWSTGETTDTIVVSPTLDTIYTVEAISNNCSSTDDITVFVNDAPNITVTDDLVLVEGDSTTLIVNGSDNYQWSTGETTVSINVTPLITTTYTVSSLGSNGCVTTLEVTVTVIPEVVANAGEDVTICSGESVSLNASGGVTYVWNTGVTGPSPTFTPTQTTTYTVTVTDAYGYSDTDSVTITVNESPNVTVSQDVTIIVGESTNLVVNGAESYLWNTGDTSNSITVNPTQTTTYTVVGTSNTCSVEAEVTVTVEEIFIASAGEDQQICENDAFEIVLTANQGDSYLWNTGATTQSITVNPLSTSTYTVTITNGSQQDTDDITIYVDPSPNVVIANGNSVDIMDGDFVTLSASGANTYEWNNGATQPNIAVSPSITTTYAVKGYVNDCFDEKQVTVNIVPEVVADAGDDVVICLGDTTTLTATGGEDYVWSTGETTQSIEVSPTEMTEYTVTVFNTLDFDEDTVVVEIDADCEEGIEVPVEDDQDFAFEVFPNPTSDIINVKIYGSEALSNIYLYDITGKLIHQIRIINNDLNNSSTTQIDVSTLQPGMYYVKFFDVKRGELSKKIIVN